MDELVGTHYENAERAVGLARLYEDATPLGDFYRSRMRRIADLLGDTEGDLLDAGCGTGQMLRFLRRSEPGRLSLTGLDRSASMIDVARSVVSDSAVRLVVGRIEDMPFDDSSFDAVIAMGSLEYVASLDEALLEIARVTRPEGLAVLTMQNPVSPYRIWDRHVWSRIRGRRGTVASPIVRTLREKKFLAELEHVGLAVQSVRHYGLNLLLPPLDAHLPRLALRTQLRLQTLADGPLRHLATDYVVVARRARHVRREPKR